MMFNLSEDDKKAMKEGMDEWMIEQTKQCKKDAEILKHVKNTTSGAYFKHIEEEMENSDNHINYRIVDKPIGKPQHDSDYNYTAWIDQYCGMCGDDYHGTVCMKISDNKYLAWDYWM